MRVGLEKEFFVVDEAGNPQVMVEDLQVLPYDECGWLAEARGKPYNNIVEAVYSLNATIFVIERQLANVNEKRLINGLGGLKLSDAPVMKVDRKLKIKAARKFAKGIIAYQNLYGHDHHKNAQTEQMAGVHISFTEEGSYTVDHREYKYCKNFDWPQIFLALDREFKEEIAQSKRRPGFYELKPDGRVEYRSLPANVDLNKLIQVVSKIIPKLATFYLG